MARIVHGGSSEKILDHSIINDLGPKTAIFSKVQKTLIFGTFLAFLNDPEFFRKNRRVRFVPLSC